MNLNFTKTIHKFNKDAGLLDKPYVDEKECAFPIEEALEGFDDLTYAFDALGMDVESNINNKCTPKDMSRYIIDMVTNSEGSSEIADVDRLDKHLDIIVYSFGSIYKLGLTPQQAVRAIDIVMRKNMEKLNAGQDSHGKQMKPEGFVGPEAELQKILDERVNNA